jgi:hypothetical protein
MNILVEMDDEVLRLLKILINGIEFDEEGKYLSSKYEFEYDFYPHHLEELKEWVNKK